MLVVKSLLSGELVPSPVSARRSRRSPSHSKSPSVSRHRHHNENSTNNDLVTTLEDDCSTTSRDDDDGSARLGDSFVLAIDWESTYVPNHDHQSFPEKNTTTTTSTTDRRDPSQPTPLADSAGLDVSLDDPYLPPLCHHSSREPICTVRRMMGGTSPVVTKPTTATLPSSTLSVQPVWEPVATVGDSPAGRSMGSFDMPVQSSLDALSLNETLRNPHKDENGGNAALTTSDLYSEQATETLLEFSEDRKQDVDEDDSQEEEVDENRPSKAVSIPRQPVFDPPNFSSSCQEAAGNKFDDSMMIPPLPTKTITKSRKRRYEARERVKEIKTVLSQNENDNTRERRKMHTAKLYVELGRNQVEARYHPDAINSFFQAAALFRHLKKPAALAAALDHAGLAYCGAHQSGASSIVHRQHKVSRFYRCLEEALLLRKQELGPWHIDTVDTLQHLAQLCLLTGHPGRAAKKYLEVVHLRKAIFGPEHPGTAVAAHCLGNAYLQSQHDTRQAEIWFDYALAVYNRMELPSGNPSVVRLLRDRKRLERVDRWLTTEEEDEEHGGRSEANDSTPRLND